MPAFYAMGQTVEGKRYNFAIRISPFKNLAPAVRLAETNPHGFVLELGKGIVWTKKVGQVTI